MTDALSSVCMSAVNSCFAVAQRALHLWHLSNGLFCTIYGSDFTNFRQGYGEAIAALHQITMSDVAEERTGASDRATTVSHKARPCNLIGTKRRQAGLQITQHQVPQRIMRLTEHHIRITIPAPVMCLSVLPGCAVAWVCSREMGGRTLSLRCGPCACSSGTRGPQTE